MWITNKMFLRGTIRFPRGRSLSKTPWITQRVPLQLCSLLRHRKFRSLYKWPKKNSYFETFQDLFLVLCSVRANTQDVTAKQKDGSLPVLWSAINSRYQHAACCVEHRLTLANITFSVTMQNFGRLATLMK